MRALTVKALATLAFYRLQNTVVIRAENLSATYGRNACAPQTILDGLLAAPQLAVFLQIPASRKVMGKSTVPLYLRVVGWLGRGHCDVQRVGWNVRDIGVTTTIGQRQQ